MNFDDYTEVANKTAIYPPVYMRTEGVMAMHVVPIIYATLGLVSEAGEVAGKVKKIIRDDNGAFSPEKIDAIMDELGDVLWYLNAIAKELGGSLDGAAVRNNEKLLDRMQRNVIKGSGDKR